MDLAAAAKAYQRDGFVLGGPLIEREEALALAEELEARVRDRFDSTCQVFEQPDDAVDLSRVEGEHIYQLCNLFRVSEGFSRLMHNPRLGEMAAAVSGSSSIQLWIEQDIAKPAGTGSYITWHQDGIYHRGSVAPTDAFIAAWVALDDCDQDNGCMWMVPGSHRWGTQEGHLSRWRRSSDGSNFLDVPPPEKADVDVVWRAPRPCPVRAGEVHFHHPHTWHGSPANQSTRPRRAIAIHLMTDAACAGPRPDERVGLAPGVSMLEAPVEHFPVLYRRAG